jgi:hypothetical protein
MTVKGNATPVKAWTGPEISRSLRPQISMQLAQEGSTVVSPTHRPPRKYVFLVLVSGAHPTSYTMGTRSFPGVKRPGCGLDHPPLSSAEVEERVELYLYSFSGPLWPVLGWTFPVPLPYLLFLRSLINLNLRYWIGRCLTCLLHLAYLKTPAVLIFSSLCVRLLLIDRCYNCTYCNEILAIF